MAITVTIEHDGLTCRVDDPDAGSVDEALDACLRGLAGVTYTPSIIRRAVTALALSYLTDQET